VLQGDSRRMRRAGRAKGDRRRQGVKQKESEDHAAGEGGWGSGQSASTTVDST